MGIAKVPRLLMGCFLLLGLPLAVLAYDRNARHSGAAAQANDDPGPRPGPMLMTLAIRVAFRDQAPYPGFLDGPDLGVPAPDRLDSVACWRYPFVYQARNDWGQFALHQGCAWVRNGRLIRERWD